MSIILQFFLSAGVIILASLFITKCAEDISEKTGIGKLLIGSLLVASGTSTPELLVDMSAVRKGFPDLAASELIGSSLMNLLVLSIGDYFDRGKEKIFSRRASRHVLYGILSIFLTALVAVFLLLGEGLKEIEILGIGIGPIIIILCYLGGSRIAYRDLQAVPFASKIPIHLKRKKSFKNLIKPLLGFIISVVVIALAAPYLADSAKGISDKLGIGESFIGATLVALSTSLPELVITISSVRMKAFDLAIGNIYGSNCFNMVIFAPLDIVYDGSLFAAVGPSNIFICLSVIMATSVAVIGQLYHVEERVPFREPDATGMVCLILGSFALLYYLN